MYISVLKDFTASFLSLLFKTHCTSQAKGGGLNVGFITLNLLRKYDLSPPFTPYFEPKKGAGVTRSHHLSHISWHLFLPIKAIYIFGDNNGHHSVAAKFYQFLWWSQESLLQSCQFSNNLFGLWWVVNSSWYMIFQLNIFVLHSHCFHVSYRFCTLMQFLIWLLLWVFFVS